MTGRRGVPPAVAPTIGLALGLLAVACAKEAPPPGTRPDNVPPRPVLIEPTYGVSRPGFDGSARVRFDEPLSNPRGLTREVVGSPAGRYEVSPSRSGIDIRPEDGWREGVVYYLKLGGGVTDLLRNRRTTPVEWLFSTGPEIRDTEVTGRVIDRVTARGMRGAQILFLAADSVPYTAVSDTGGVFRLPGLPYGAYQAAAFTDQDRDFEYDADFEPGGTVDFALDASEERAELEILVLPADTTPPVLASAEPRDSVTLRLEFDDPLDPDADLSDVSLTVRDSLSGEALAVDTFAVGDLPRPEPETAESLAAADTVAVPDTVAMPDTVAVPDTVARPDTVAAPDSVAVPDSVAAADSVPPPPELEPARAYLSVRLVAPLSAGTYRVTVDGVPNLRDLRGGGEASFEYEPPPPPEDEAEDEAEAMEAEAADSDAAGEPERP